MITALSELRRASSSSITDKIASALGVAVTPNFPCARDETGHHRCTSGNFGKRPVLQYRRRTAAIDTPKAAASLTIA
jgi:hypothetical protein